MVLPQESIPIDHCHLKLIGISRLNEQSHIGPQRNDHDRQAVIWKTEVSGQALHARTRSPEYRRETRGPADPQSCQRNRTAIPLHTSMKRGPDRLHADPAPSIGLIRENLALFRLRARIGGRSNLVVTALIVGFIVSTIFVPEVIVALRFF